VIVPFTRGSMMIWRSSITPMARVTASMSALTKFNVTGELAFTAGPLPAPGRPRWSVALSGWACVAPWASSSAETAATMAVRGRFMIIRS